ncbi:MAG TPA: DUF192 domain-containing protein, partial [Alphaproteobacteria bacterium]|nr:DUF192 domain-containing protein [Alphaproteobacteria bacterium]
TEPLVLVAQNGARHVFNVEVAKTPSQLQQGLMYRNHMAADRGMLFLFPAEEVARMWMHNTHMPLDMLFIDRDGKIASITANARPFDDTPISSHVPVHAALEINGGMAQTLGIGVGGEVESESLKRFLQ